MKYISKDKYFDVRSYDGYKEVCITYSNRIFRINSKINIQSSFQLNTVFNFGDYTLILDDLNKPYLLDDNSLNSIDLLDFRIGSLKYPYIEFYKKEQPRKYGIFDYEKRVILFETTEWIGRDIIEEHIFSNYQGAITCRNINLAQPLWQFDLTIFGEYTVLFSTEKKKFEVSKFLGAWQNELIVACEGGLVLSLDIETGKPIRHWDKLPASADSDIKDVFRGNLHQSGHVYQLNLAVNKIVAIYYRHIVEIDLFSGEIITKNLSESLSKHFISEFQLKSGYAEDDTHYYTTVHFDKTLLKLNYLPTAVCAINKETLEIDWFHRFDEDGKGDFVSIQVPQVSNGKLYQLTANKVLHIFEKETGSSGYAE